jgi:plasmid stability protein
MATLTIRNLEDSIKTQLRIQAARHGRSMEEEARTILKAAVAASEPASAVQGLGSHIHAHFARLGGVELELPDRHSIPQPPAFTQTAE